MDIKTSNDSPTLICDNIFIGNMTNANDKDSLKKLGITHILICGSYLDAYFPSDFTYKKLDINDLPCENVIILMEETFKFIKESIEKNGNVLLHCAAGISRSTTFLLGYLMKEKDWSYIEALNYIKVKYKKAAPNFGFICQLKKYESILKDKKSFNY